MRAARTVLLSLIPLLLMAPVAGTGAASATDAKAGKAPLFRLAEHSDRYYGTAIVLDQLGSNQPYISVARKQFDMVTPRQRDEMGDHRTVPGHVRLRPR
jgi:hypothetical protein